MSNLSDLLPAGGGGKQVDFVASGTLGSGVTVALNSNGTVSVAGETSIPQTVGAESVYGIASSNGIAFDSVTNKIVVAYRDNNNSGYGTAIVGTVSGTSISFGTPVVFASTGIEYTSVVFDSANNKIVIAYKGGVSRGKAIVGTISGGVISFGTEAQFESGTTNHISATFESSTNKVVIVYADGGDSNFGKAVVGTVSGTSISFGGITAYNNASTISTSVAYDINADKIVVTYINNNDSYGYCRVGAISGTDITFPSSSVSFTYNPQGTATTYDSNATKVVIAYGANSNYYGTAIVGTVSGTSISFGSPTTFQNLQIGSSLFASFDSNSNKVVIAYGVGTASGSLVVGTVSASSISFGSPVVFNNTGTTDNITSCFDSTSNKIVIAYRDSSNSNSGTSVVFQNASTTTNYTSFIGITDQAIADGASGKVVVQGGVSEKVTGLTANTDYYVQSNGSISTTASSVPAGKALSSTSILLKG